jgi:alkanesulfonate monooxygenase SsuD/methylene tetrahydromethanopterin reductase-like flavin-dependent oxidoreductase (luciferase family)
MFRSYFFTEMPYPHVMPHPYGPDPAIETCKVQLGNGYFDPDTGHELYRKYFDMYAAADELGLDVMLNEHHQTATCLASTVPLNMAIVARETKRARILALGNPIANRADPVRVAEELALIDVLSQGRLQAGLVRGSSEEIAATNTNPVFQQERYWEALDLIVKAWTTHDGPFSWEGKHFQHRQVNIWPRPYQQPHPPIWVTTMSGGSSAAKIAERGYTIATFPGPAATVRSIFDAYKRRLEELERPPAPLDKFCYYGYVFVGDTDEKALEEAEKIRFHVKQIKCPPQFYDVPGYVPAAARGQRMAASAGAGRNGGGALPTDMLGYLETAPIAELGPEAGFFVGNPDTVFEQLRDFYNAVGGFGHFVMHMQCGGMTYDLTHSSMELFSREVLPRFRDEVHNPAVEASLGAAVGS